MSGNWQLALLAYDKDSARVLNCAERCRDYILMETGREPDATWVTGFFNDAPPDRGADDILSMGIEEPDGALSGLLGIAPGYESASEWYLGLLLIDPAKRGQGIGATVLREVVKLAKSSGAESLKVAVLSANTDGLRFWQRHGFVHFRDAPDEGDGHDRLVLQRML
ncbi:MAG: GNAT family N-acetyltransferase [Litoreibacter sp.]|nr:GNAT family N-acetyltransferase [Litoreibacter sp.]